MSDNIILDVFAEHGAATGAAIQAAINACVAASDGVKRRIYLSGREWSIDTKLTIPAGARAIHLFGDPHDFGFAGGTILRATGTWAAGTPMLEVLSSYHSFADLKFDADRRADYGVYFQNATLTHWTRVHIWNALLDGGHCPMTGLNQGNTFDRCTFIHSGTVHATAGIINDFKNGWKMQINGTAATTAGNAVITISNGPPPRGLTALKIRPGSFIRVGGTEATAFYGQILSVTTNTVTLQLLDLPAQSLTSQPYAIGVGNNWHEERSDKNGFNHFVNGSILRGAGGAGIWMNALYGDSVRDSLVDYNGMVGIAFGTNDNIGSAFQCVADHVYMEENTVDYFFGNGVDVAIREPTINLSVFSAGTTANGTITRKGRVESVKYGAPQNFLIEVRNNGGMLEHRIAAERWDGFASLGADKIIGASVTWTQTPSVAAGVDFATGVGIVAAAPHILLLKVALEQNPAINGTAVVEFNSTALGGTTLTPYASLTTDSVNVNGVTLVRPAIYLSTTSGAFINWSTANIGTGESIGIRVQAFIR